MVLWLVFQNENYPSKMIAFGGSVLVLVVMVVFFIDLWLHYLRSV